MCPVIRAGPLARVAAVKAAASRADGGLLPKPAPPKQTLGANAGGKPASGPKTAAKHAVFLLRKQVFYHTAPHGVQDISDWFYLHAYNIIHILPYSCFNLK
jgi:hypothetical protein